MGQNGLNTRYNIVGWYVFRCNRMFKSIGEFLWCYIPTKIQGLLSMFKFIIQPCSLPCNIWVLYSTLLLEMRHWSFTMRHRSSDIQHSSFIIQHSSFIIQHLFDFIWIHSTRAVERSMSRLRDSLRPTLSADSLQKVNHSSVKFNLKLGCWMMKLECWMSELRCLIVKLQCRISSSNVEYKTQMSHGKEQGEIINLNIESKPWILAGI